MQQPNQDRLRHLPQQARSQKRFNQILDAAAEVFVEVGYEGATTNAIAAHAKTSIGALYRFFPDKLAIFHALAARYLNQIGELFAAFQDSEAAQLSLDLYVNQVLDSFDQFVTVNPAYRVVFVQSRFSPDILAMDADLNRQIAQQLEAFFAQRDPEQDPAQRALIAVVCVEVASVLESLSLTRDQDFQKRVLTETKNLLIGYLKQYFPDQVSDPSISNSF